MAEKPKTPSKMTTLEKVWRKELWTNDDFFSQQTFWTIKFSSPYSYSDTETEVYTQSVEEKWDNLKGPRSKRDEVLDAYQEAKELFFAAKHSESDYEPQYNQHPSNPDFTATKEWYIRWVLKQHWNSWNGFKERLELAKKHGWIGELEELDPEATQEKLGETKEENLLRLIGILKNMLSEKNVIEQLKKDPTAFKNQKELSQYISGLYGEDLPSKGLEPATLNKIWSTANKILKED